MRLAIRISWISRPIHKMEDILTFLELVQYKCSSTTLTGLETFQIADINNLSNKGHSLSTCVELSEVMVSINRYVHQLIPGQMICNYGMPILLTMLSWLFYGSTKENAGSNISSTNAYFPLSSNSAFCNMIMRYPTSWVYPNQRIKLHCKRIATKYSKFTKGIAEMKALFYKRSRATFCHYPT